MLGAMALSILIVVVVVLVHYEVLRLMSDKLPRLTMPPRSRIIIVIFGVFLAHTVEVWIIAVILYVAELTGDMGMLTADHPVGFYEHVYFVVATYTSLGYGDVLATGPLRLPAGVTALVGLVMIGWSASFTYLAMEKFWGLHRKGDR